MRWQYTGEKGDRLQGPDPHDMFGCSVPFSLWVGSLFVATLSYYTTDYMRQGQDASEKRTERYVYDPTAGELLRALCNWSDMPVI